MATVQLKNVNKCFGATEVIPDVSLQIPHGSFTVFVGPSGCGKSTLMRLIAGLEDVTRGDIHIDDKEVTFVRPVDRGIAMVFQSYALYPHMSVEENIGFGLKMAKVPKQEIKQRVHAAAATLQLDHLLARKPGELSGGQRQRVAIGRAIVREPKVFLFDEPLSNLDAALRTQMRVELAQLHKRLGATMVYVTHDQVEAMTLADQIVVLNKGNIEQIGTPMQLYQNPRTLFVAGFIGSPKMNLISGQLAEAWQAHTIGIRPEHLEIMEEGGTWQGTVLLSERLGSDTYLHLDVPGAGTLIARAPGNSGHVAGQRVGLSPQPDCLHRFDSQGLATRAGHA